MLFALWWHSQRPSLNVLSKVYLIILTHINFFFMFKVLCGFILQANSKHQNPTQHTRRWFGGRHFLLLYPCIIFSSLTKRAFAMTISSWADVINDPRDPGAMTVLTDNGLTGLGLVITWHNSSCCPTVTCRYKYTNTKNK